jgi:hypothetical protein
MPLCVSAVANEPAAIKLPNGEYGRASEEERSNAKTLHVSEVANEPAAIQLHAGDYSRAAEL